jgi:hypothetical protein
MASEFPVEGDKLKKLVKKARSMPIAFGFNPGTADDDDEWLAAHARKAPELLGKMAVTEGAGTRSAFGTFRVDGSELHLTCLRSIPQLAKKFKKYLKRFKVTLNVVVLDPNGNVIDSDVEVLTDWFKEEEDAQDLVDDVADAVAEAAEAAEMAPSDVDMTAEADPAQAATLTARLKALQPRVVGLPPAAAEKLAAAFRGAVQLIKGNLLGAAAATIAQMETVVERLAGLPQGTPPVAPPQPAAGADPRLARLREAVEKLGQQATAALGDGAGPVLDRLQGIARQIDAGEAEAAMTGLRAVQEQIKAAQAAREKWDKALAILQPQVERALSGPGADDLRAKWGFATGLAGEGATDRALASLPAVIAALKALGTAGAPGETPPGTPPKGVVAFQRSRVLWVGARQRMLAEAEALRDAIVAASADDEDAADVAAAAEEILQDVARIDTRLQDALDAITNAEEGRARDALKQRAAGIVAEYRTLLGTGVLRMIDQNPFKPVSVAAGARLALDQIARTLAA